MDYSGLTAYFTDYPEVAWTALVLFVLAMAWRVYGWFAHALNPAEAGAGVVSRVFAAFRGMVLALFSSRILSVLRALFLDVLLQLRIWRQGFWRWLAHLALFWGFVLLVVFHALGPHTSAQWFNPDYARQAPFVFLRDLLGALALAGLMIFALRRLFSKRPRFSSSAGDWLALAVVASILVSGVLLAGVKITSETEFEWMAADYAGLYPEYEEYQALLAYWVEEYGVVSEQTVPPFDPDVLEYGMDMHAGFCAECHSAAPRSGVLSWPASRALAPAAGWLERNNAGNVLFWAHILLTLGGLVYVPFGKMLHVLTTPLSLLVRAGMDVTRADPRNLATRRMMELDACMHCDTCSMGCSVGVVSGWFGNENILPSKKLRSLGRLARGKALGERDLRAIEEGLCICTNCNRCTVACPAGIGLKQQWATAFDRLIGGQRPQHSLAGTFSFYHGIERPNEKEADYGSNVDRARSELAPGAKPGGEPISMEAADRKFRQRMLDSYLARTFAGCYNCEVCTNACPVVGAAADPERDVGMTPSQIIRAVGLGMPDLAMGAPMLWNCLTCYKCQELCPTGVRVTDVFYELKNRAYRQQRESGGPDGNAA
ncbi:MAG: 4Fe-4S dicluster domain-containing protein [Desulfatibacillaceae bacterium]